MKPTIVPIPEPQTQPEEQPVPEVLPRRRTFIQPVFTGRVRRIKTKAVIIFALLLSATATQAQTQPFPDPPSAPGVPSQPMHPDAPREPRTAPQQPADPQTPTQDGWIMFDDRAGKELGLDPAMLQSLRDVDDRYQKDYSALGNSPTKNPAYRSLSDRRNADVKGILSADQYERWMQMKPQHMQQGTNDNGGDGRMKSGTTNTPQSATPTTTPKKKTEPAPAQSAKH